MTIKHGALEGQMRLIVCIFRLDTSFHVVFCYDFIKRECILNLWFEMNYSQLNLRLPFHIS